MKFVIVGTGEMGGALASALSRRTQHEICVRGSRLGSSSAVGLAQEFALSEASDHDLEVADVIFVAVPWNAIAITGKLLNGYRGIIVSVVVPWADGGDPRTNVTSAAERLASALPTARLVNAFTSISSSIIRNPGNGERPSVLACSDDDEAKNLVMEIAQEIGLDSVNGGKLVAARYAEGLGLLWTHLAFEAGYGDRVTFRVFVAD